MTKTRTRCPQRPIRLSHNWSSSSSLLFHKKLIGRITKHEKSVAATCDPVDDKRENFLFHIQIQIRSCRNNETRSNSTGREVNLLRPTKRHGRNKQNKQSQRAPRRHYFVPLYHDGDQRRGGGRNGVAISLWYIKRGRKLDARSRGDAMRGV